MGMLKDVVCMSVHTLLHSVCCCCCWWLCFAAAAVAAAAAAAVALKAGNLLLTLKRAMTNAAGLTCLGAGWPAGTPPW
jgi:hypothetical protein